MTHDRMKNK